MHDGIELPFEDTRFAVVAQHRSAVLLRIDVETEPAGWVVLHETGPRGKSLVGPLRGHGLIPIQSDPGEAISLWTIGTDASRSFFFGANRTGADLRIWFVGERPEPGAGCVPCGVWFGTMYHSREVDRGGACPLGEPGESLSFEPTPDGWTSRATDLSAIIIARLHPECP